MSKSKIQVILEMKDRLSKGIGRAKKSVSKGVDTMNRKLGSFKAKNIEAFSAITNEIPGVGRALELLSNPYVALTAVVVGLSVAMFKLGSHLNDLSKEAKAVQV
ncbi:hypothetical protein, partial [Flammeovirga sp. OC4]|uniref:hypothetical protein n=1 Tax=Flammeovirga sp. OC4 TaxID=1382345 RepID=UPI0012E08D95